MFLCPQRAHSLCGEEKSATAIGKVGKLGKGLLLSPPLNIRGYHFRRCLSQAINRAELKEVDLASWNRRKYQVLSLYDIGNRFCFASQNEAIPSDGIQT